jgi:hypothetical protein
VAKGPSFYLSIVLFLFLSVLCDFYRTPLCAASVISACVCHTCCSSSFRCCSAMGKTGGSLSFP